MNYMIILLLRWSKTNFEQVYLNNVQIGLYVLDGFQKMAAEYRQEELNQKMKDSLDKMVKAFHIEG